MLFAQVLLPVPLDRLFTYSVSEELLPLICPGTRVMVPFGKTRRMCGVVMSISSTVPEECAVKPVEQVLDRQFPAFTPTQLKLMQWMWEYHICAPGDVLKAALPGMLRPDTSAKTVPYSPRTESFVRLGPAVKGKDLKYTSLLFDVRSSRQLQVFDTYMSLSGLDRDISSPKPVTRKHLAQAAGSASALKSLLDKGMLEVYDVEVGRLPAFDGQTVQPAVLSPAQAKALEGIKTAFKTKNVCLLHGVTSCGKTEMYIHLIEEQLSLGRQVLYLLPEIALTTQIQHRLARVFAGRMCCYHSGCPDNIRAEIWERQCGPTPYGLVLGARSSVMLPFQNLGLIIVDEEHEPSYKQEDPAPRYHGRNTAIMLASLSDAKVLLGSATPSIESYSNAQIGKYALVELRERYGQVSMPGIEIVDVADLRKRHYMNGLFSPALTAAIQSSLSSGGQTILFLNRRGFTSTVECPDCGWVQKCDCCDVSLTYHKNTDSAVCHYCGRTYRVPQLCPSCGRDHLKGHGYGTERIEEDVRKLLPTARVARLDTDSARQGYERILTDFQEGRTDILIGTQMVSKGLDFDNVRVVGILQADSLISSPDFRASERAYQLMAQVSGRAGRRDGNAVVLLQTRQTGLPLLEQVRTGDYSSFYACQMQERHLFQYPPYSRLVSISVKGKELEKVCTAAQMLADNLTVKLEQSRILGPEAPVVSKVQFMHIRRILLKAPLAIGVGELHRALTESTAAMTSQVNGVTVSFDVDPQ